MAIAQALDFITVKGFKSIASLRLDLRPINVLIGANGSGKSNFISVFSFLHEISEGRLQDYVRRAGGADQVWLPRLPNEDPLPARASASPGVRAIANAAITASRKWLRRMVHHAREKTPAIWGTDHAPARVIPSTRTVGASVPRRKRRSFAGVRWANISIKFPATVISATGSASCPSRIMNPAAPRL